MVIKHGWINYPQYIYAHFLSSTLILCPSKNDAKTLLVIKTQLHLLSQKQNDNEGETEVKLVIINVHNNNKIKTCKSL